MAIMPVKTRSGATRRRNPAETRRRILEAARNLFTEQGYASTTLAAIADRAGVAVQTVYFTFHTKGELLMAVVLAAGADDPGAPRHQDRGWYREMVASTDARRQLALLSEHGTDIFARIAPLIGLVEAARASDANLDTAWHQTVVARRDALRDQMEVVARNGALRPELGVDDAADIVYVLQRPETLRALTTECGWSIERYKAWLYRTLCHQLLAGGPGTGGDVALATAGMSFVAELHRYATEHDERAPGGRSPDRREPGSTAIRQARPSPPAPAAAAPGSTPTAPSSSPRRSAGPSPGGA